METSELARLLREVPAFPDGLPVLDPGEAPTVPGRLFADWLEEAIASGARQANALTFTTARADVTPVGRTVTLKVINTDSDRISTHRSSRTRARR